MAANASAASLCRVSGLTEPRDLTSRSTSAYCVGLLTAATPGKFLAAARSSAHAPDVDLLERLVQPGVRLTDRLGERIQVDDDDVDRLEALRGQLGEVFRLVAARQQRGEDARVQRLDAAAENLVRIGQVRCRPDAFEAVVVEVGAGALGREQLDPGVGEAASKLDNAFSITDGEQGAQSSTSGWMLDRWPERLSSLDYRGESMYGCLLDWLRRWEC